VERRATPEEYVASPGGAYFAGEGVLHFFAAPDLCGTVFWGRPDATAVRLFTRAVLAELPEHSALHDAYVDARGLTGIDPGAFAVLSAFMGERAEAFGVNVKRQALVRPDGVVGALVSGFYDVTPAVGRERSRVVMTPDEAFAWLGRSDAGAIVPAIEAAKAEASGVVPVVAALRAHVTERPRARLADAARALSLAPRALQEELRSAGTTFRDEVNASRIEAAKTALAGGERKLSALAAELGFSSVQHFSTLFRKVAGCSPTEWRARRRDG